MVELNEHLENIQTEIGDAAVYKEESVYDFDTPVSADLTGSSSDHSHRLAIYQSVMDYKTITNNCHRPI